MIDLEGFAHKLRADLNNLMGFIQVFAGKVRIKADTYVDGTLYLNDTAVGTWVSWTPSFTGFSADPSGGIYRYALVGKTCILSVRMPSNGTSNANTFTITLPFTAATVTGMYWSGLGVVTDNGTIQTTPGLLVVTSAATALQIFKDCAGAVWTASGNKRLNEGTLIYEIA